MELTNDVCVDGLVDLGTVNADGLYAEDGSKLFKCAGKGCLGEEETLFEDDGIGV